MTGLFRQYQPVYADLGISTIPCSTDEKTSLVKHFGRMGIVASNELARKRKFSDANAIGIVPGRRNRITVLDVDTTDERVFEDAIARHGETRMAVRTSARKFHAYYRFNGERRRVRPWGKETPIDLLGQAGGKGSIVIAPPSLFGDGQYQIIQGSLDDLTRLTAMRGVDDLKQRRALTGESRSSSAELVKQGHRNDWLWRQCMRHARHCDNFDALLDVARTLNENCEPMMEEKEIMTIVQSAWDCTQRGQNRFGQHGAWIPVEDAATMMTYPDALALLVYLKANEGPWATFMIPNTLAEKFEWPLRRLQNARQLLIEKGRIKQVKLAYPGSPALFQWLD